MKTKITEVFNQETFDRDQQEWITTITVWWSNEFGTNNSEFELTHDHKIQDHDKERFKVLAQAVGISQKELKKRIFHGSMISIQ